MRRGRCSIRLKLSNTTWSTRDTVSCSLKDSTHALEYAEFYDYSKSYPNYTEDGDFDKDEEVSPEHNALQVVQLTLISTVGDCSISPSKLTSHNWTVCRMEPCHRSFSQNLESS